jgi:hypothetical protein
LTCENSASILDGVSTARHREETPMSIADNAVDPTTDPSGRYAPAEQDLPEPPQLDADSDEDDQSAQSEPDEMELPS